MQFASTYVQWRNGRSGEQRAENRFEVTINTAEAAEQRMTHRDSINLTPRLHTWPEGTLLVVQRPSCGEVGSMYTTY